MTSIRTLILTFLAAALALAGGCGKRDSSASAAKPDPAVPVTLRPVKVSTVQRSIEVVGTLWGDEDATISNKVAGRVITIFKDVGDHAEPGEALAQIDTGDYELDKRQKESALAEVLAKLGLQSPPAEQFDISALPTVQRARLQTENAQSKFERGKKLHDQQPPLISDQDFADLKTAYDVAKSNFDVEMLTARSLLSEVKTRQAELAIANQALQDTTVRAPQVETSPATRPAQSPRGYVVVARMASLGEYERPVTAMFRLVDDDPVKLRAAVPEVYVSQVKVGQKVNVRVDSYDRTFAGAVSRINPQVDPANRTFQVEVLVPNSERLLRPGAFATARIETRVDRDVVFVPQEAVISFAGANKAYTVQDGKAQENNLELGDRQGDYMEVIKGLDASATVVVSGNTKLAQGLAVALAAADAPPVTNPTVRTDSEQVRP
jgi:membrane fusion protein (multidrug efflux system)